MYTVDKDDGDGDATVVFSAPSLKFHGRKLSSMWKIDTRCWVSMSEFHIFVELTLTTTNTEEDQLQQRKNYPTLFNSILYYET